jgi:prefoldin subunit 2
MASQQVSIKKQQGKTDYHLLQYVLLPRPNVLPVSRAPAAVFQLQEYPATAGAKNWGYRAGNGRTQVSVIDEALLGGLWCLDVLSTNIRYGRLVIETLEPLPQNRKCFRMVNGVLVERTIKDVIPSLKTNADGLKQVLDELLKQYKAKQNEMDTWKVS